MQYKPLGAGFALVVCVVALALAPGSTSAQSLEAIDPLDISLSYLEKNAPQLGVSAGDVSDLVVTSSYRSSHNGVTHINLSQRFRGLEVFGGHVTVSVADEGSVVFAGGSLVPDLAASPSGSDELKATDAVAAAADHLGLDEPTDLQVISADGDEIVVSGGGISDAPIPVRQGWQATAGGLRVAWELTIDDSSAPHLWNARVDAASGDLLGVEDWTSHDDLVDLSTLARSEEAAAAVASGPTSPNPVADGSSYRVFNLPKESPNDGAQELVTNPADAPASPFGWHDTNGALGAEFTITRGTNVHAYLDQDDSNSADFGDTNGGPGLDFDFPADLTQHAQNYRDAVVTNLFYMNNIFHDVMWRYGFDEPSGNFQANNYGRGGTSGDYVRAEAADGSGTNNANFSTPVETSTSGGTPRMQMYLWPGNQFGAQNQVVAEGVGSFNATWSRFGPAPTPGGVAGTFVYAGTGCNAGLYPASLPTTSWIALVDGGTAACTYLLRVQVAQSLGAGGVVVAHNSSASPPVLTASMTTPPVGIPAVAISQADANAIKAAIAAGSTTGTLRKHPNHPGIRDGDFENGIIIHEYGHGVSNRLTGGPGVNCLTGNEQAGEGWSDYFAITLLLDPALDDPDEPRGMGPYALFQDDRHAAGIRPRPYSRDMAIQPFTYDSIKTGGWLNGTSLALPHGLGHGWAAVLWDLNWDLIDKHGFNPNAYEAWNTGGNNRALQYVVDGLKLQGCGPGLVVARAAIVAATEALGGEDTCTVWATFARRGLGYSAVQGTTNRDDNQEAFDTHPDCLRGFSGSIADEPTLNKVRAGATRPMVFTIGGDRGLDFLVEGSPYSRQVDCTTLRTLDPQAEFVTPRPIPVPTETPGSSGLSYDATTESYTYPWKTLKAWDGTCREFVLTRKDGIQHRAYFRFSTAPSFPVSGRVLDADGQPVAGATVSLAGTQLPHITTTDANGLYAFAEILKGPYTATATGGGCDAPHTQQVEVRGPTTLNFSLPRKTDTFGYSCSVAEDIPFEEADTVLALTGDDVSTLITLPFPFSLYGTTYTGARVCTNGYIELGAPSSLCAITNAAIPTTGRPNGAVYAYWDDLFVDAQASVRTQLKGDAPNRRFVIEYRNVRYFGDTTRRLDVSLVLYENGQILTQTRNLADDGRERGNSATLGIENQTGEDALRYSFNEAVLGVEPAVTSILYTPPA